MAKTEELPEEQYDDDVDDILAESDEIDAGLAWFRLEGPKYGPDSRTPLKALVSAGDGNWDIHISEANSRITASMHAKKREQFNKDTSGGATYPTVHMATALRGAITKGKVLRILAYAGPNFDDPADFEAACNGAAQVMKAGKPWPMPADARDTFMMTESGQVQYPTQKEPPISWQKSTNAMFKLMKSREFLRQVAQFRGRLEDRGQAAVVDDQKNLQPLPDSQPLGNAKTEAQNQP